MTWASYLVDESIRKTLQMLKYAANTARYVDRIGRGAKPGELPIEQPARFELAIDLRTAAALGLTIPETMLQRAEEVFR